MVSWYRNLRLDIAEQGERIPSDYLIGLQVGNEPDLYASHGHRPVNYSPFDYFGEFGVMAAAIANNSNIRNQNLLIGPNIATGAWTPEMVWNTGFVQSYSPQLAYLAVEQCVTFFFPFFLSYGHLKIFIYLELSYRQLLYTIRCRVICRSSTGIP